MSYATGPSPHIYSAGSVPGFFWKPASFLILLVGLYTYDQGSWVLFNAVAAMAAAVATEVLAGSLFKNKIALSNGHTLLIALVTCLMFPPTVSPWLVAFAAFSAIFFGKELWGGLGNGLFHPAILGYIFIKVFFPFQSPEQESLFPVWIWGIIYGVIAIILMIWRWARWDVTLCYLGVLCLGINLTGRLDNVFTCLPALFLSGLYLIHQPEILPLTPGNRKFFALICAIISGVLFPFMKVPEVFYFPILWSSILSPWMDSLIRPRFARQVEGA